MDFRKALDQLQYNFNHEHLINVEKEIDAMLKNIFESESPSSANSYFNVLEEIQFVLSKLSFKENVDLPNSLQNFVRNFDRLDSNEFRKRIFLDIKAGALTGC